MAGFKFEKDLLHQAKAVESILKVYDGAVATMPSEKAMANVANPRIAFDPTYRYCDNIVELHKRNGIGDVPPKCQSRVIDIMMETGTGKTYTYTKSMLELHKSLGIWKFIVIVPTLSIKAGTLSFLKAKATQEHFREEYGCGIATHVVESQKKSKSKKSYMPQAVREFVESSDGGKKRIHVLVINAGMINSDTMSKKFDVTLFDKYNTPFDAVASVNPVTIVDEPHKFAQGNVTWTNIQKFKSQYIFRYGATFNDAYENLIYNLTAVDAFNQNLVKGVVAYVEEFKEGRNALFTLKSSNAKEANFELNLNGEKSTHKVAPKESLGKVHPEMEGLFIEKMNQTKVILSNGLELKRGEKLNPYSYAQSLQDKMMERAIRNHFEIEQKLLTRDVAIKPLTLFFIDDIEGYRDGNAISGSLKKKFESIAKATIKKLLKTVSHERYKKYLEASLKDVSSIHGGYFSKDNSESDEKIEKEINEILHDKESLLSLENPRRFIFSKWTLREGWDNPNVFQICKLRSSGSTTSKLQEVGRGLRLPVNEYMSRVKDENFDLHYFVDFSENSFVKDLVDEINNKSGAVGTASDATKLSDEMIKAIIEKYSIDEDVLLEELDNKNAIKRNNDFKEDGFSIVKELYPDAFEGLQKGKIRSNTEANNKATLRVGKYDELKSLWESINQKVVLEYKIDDEEEFYILLKEYLGQSKSQFKPSGAVIKSGKLKFYEGIAFYKEQESINEEILPIATMSYKHFLVELSKELSVNMMTLHRLFIELQSEIDINLYLNMQTIRTMRAGFNAYLLDNALAKFSVGYNNITNKIHPTKLTDKNGQALATVSASAIGVDFDDKESVASTYLFEELFYDSQLERENIVKEIDEVIVFTKIPKSSIRIPVAGGGTYSPDFAYVVKEKSGEQTLNLVVETKNKEERLLDKAEKQKIEHAKVLFSNLPGSVKVEFRAQFQKEKITEIIKNAMAQ